MMANVLDVLRVRNRPSSRQWNAFYQWNAYILQKMVWMTRAVSGLVPISRRLIFQWPQALSFLVQVQQEARKTVPINSRRGDFKKELVLLFFCRGTDFQCMHFFVVADCVAALVVLAESL